MRDDTAIRKASAALEEAIVIFQRLIEDRDDVPDGTLMEWAIVSAVSRVNDDGEIVTRIDTYTSGDGLPLYRTRGLFQAGLDVLAA